MKKILDVSYGTVHDRQTLDVYIPDKKVEAVFIFFHGGGIEKGSKDVAKHFYTPLVNNGVALVSANYKLYPNAKYPEFINDGALVVKWVKDNVELFNTDKIYVGGSSAGGYISMMLCFNKQYLSEVGLSNSDISGYFHDAGQPTAHFRVLMEKGMDHRRVVVDETAPLYYVGLEESYPRMRFIVSDNDMPARLEQIMLIEATLDYFKINNHDRVLMRGKHTGYVGHVDETGKNVYAELILDFIKNS